MAMVPRQETYVSHTGDSKPSMGVLRTLLLQIRRKQRGFREKGEACLT